MLNKNDMICSCCGCVITENDDYTIVDDDIYCSDCFDDKFTYCDICGDIVERDSITVIEGEYVCGDCLDENYVQCCECGDYIHIDDSWYSDVTNEHYCEWCFNDTHSYCDCCDRYVLNDDYDYDNCCCYDCINDNIIGKYHSHTYDFIGKASENSYHKGIELEVEPKEYWYDNNTLAERLYSAINDSLPHIYFEHDGSLNDGFEIISNPHTLEEFYKVDWEKLLKTCVDGGYISHNANTCGLHIHYSREWFGDDIDTQIFNIGKLIAFYERHLEDMLKFSRRTWETYSRWADNYHTDGDVEKCKSCAYGCNTRYKYINLTNSNTIEFRLGRGTLNYKSFMAWNDFHDCLITNVKNVSYEDIDNLDKWLNGINDDTIDYLKSKDCFYTLWN